MAVAEYRFRVMASKAQVLLNDATPDAPGTVHARLDQLEQLWSRFLPDSDISRLAKAGGAQIKVASETVFLLETMQLAQRNTFGSFNPTMLREIVGAGYDTSIDNPSRRSVTIDLPHPAATIDDIAIDGCNVALPEGMAIDPGGIGKGLAADIVATELVRGGTAGALVGVGGDLSAVGIAPAGGWTITVDHPLHPGNALTTVSIDAGGVATSSTLSRRWSQGGLRRHHVLDPATGRPSASDLAAVTVFAPSAWEAEVHATAALLRGSISSIDYLAAQGLSGIAVDVHGTCLTTNDLVGCDAGARGLGARS